MANISEQKQQEIKKMIFILEKMDSLGIALLTRDADTLLAYQDLKKELDENVNKSVMIYEGDENVG